VAGGLRMVALDAVLFEQVLFNLLDNAAKYAPADSTIRIRGWQESGAVLLQVIDEGDGIPPADLERIFDKFYRVQKGDQVRAGTGLGLAISRGFIEALHGTITAANRTDRSGAAFTIRMPVPAAQRQMGTAACVRPRSRCWGRRRAADPQTSAPGPRYPGVRDPRCAERQGRARADRAKARSDHPRSRPARHRGSRAPAHHAGTK